MGRFFGGQILNIETDSSDGENLRPRRLQICSICLVFYFLSYATLTHTHLYSESMFPFISPQKSQAG